jgi:hypothetical protein
MRESDRSKAIAEARQRLLPLFIDIQCGNEPDVKSTEKARQHATALLNHLGLISDIARQNAISALDDVTVLKYY